MGKSLSAFISSSLKHLSSCGGSHSLTETVYFALLSFFGLERSFHNLFSCFLVFILFFFLIVYRGISHDNFSYYTAKAQTPSSNFTRFFAFFFGNSGFPFHSERTIFVILSVAKNLINAHLTLNTYGKL